MARSRLVQLAVALSLGLVVASAYLAEQYQAVKIVGVSMAPTIELGDWVVVERGTYVGEEGPRRGEVIAYRTETRLVVKRVVGVAGDTIELWGEDLFVNGERVPSEYMGVTGRARVYREKLGDHTYLSRVVDDSLTRPEGRFVVPASSVFLIGDNRNQSEDSRELGAVPLQDIVGRVQAVAYSPTRGGITAGLN